jgi:hypothetical protein
MSENNVDHLDVDMSIPGQEWVCLSFISPDKLIKEYEAYKACKFLKSYLAKEKLDVEKVYSEYMDYTYKYQKEIQRDFDEQNDFKTSMRGVKVRGVYSLKEDAENRAKSLAKTDSTFNVFVGQVGYWLPWDPNPDNVDKEVFSNEELNNLMNNYKQNAVDKDIFYEQEKRDKVKAAREEYLRNKKLEEEERAKEKLEEIEDISETNSEDISETKTEDPVEEIDTKLNDSINQSLEEMDPWMKNKIDNMKSVDDSK